MAWKVIDASGRTKGSVAAYGWNVLSASGSGLTLIDHGALSGLADDDHTQYLLVADIDDTPVNGETAQPISSNWAFDHVAAADPHTGYILESLIDAAGDLIVGTADNTVGRLAKGTDDQVLTMVAGAVAWATAASGGFSAPQGRLTLVTGTPVMSSEQAAKTTIYYTPYQGDKIPLYDGSAWSMTTFTELSIAMAASANWAADKNFDLFVYNDSGTLRLVTGAAWTNDTTRAEALVRTNGIWLNNASFTGRYAAGSTVSIAASRATYVGTMRTSAEGTTTWEIGGSAAGGDEIRLFLWNAYNRVRLGGMSQDSTDTWTYATATWRSANTSTANRASFVVGLNEDAIHALYSTSAYAQATASAAVGIALDSTSAPTESVFASYNDAISAAAPTVTKQPGLGYHFVQALEIAFGGINATFYGDSGGNINCGLNFTGMF